MAKSRKYKYTKKNKKTRKSRKSRHRHSLGKKCKVCSRSKSFKGGACSSCLMRGGNHFYKPAAPIPGPFVGESWNAPVNNWPGVNGVGGDRNYLAYNNYPTDPQTAMILEGGKRRRGSRRSRRGKGGGLIPQDLVNVGRDIGFNMGSAYNALRGYQAPVNPLPYKDQLPGTDLRSLI